MISSAAWRDLPSPLSLPALAHPCPSLPLPQSLGLLLGSLAMNPKSAQTIASVVMLTMVGAEGGAVGCGLGRPFARTQGRCMALCSAREWPVFELSAACLTGSEMALYSCTHRCSRAASS